MSNLFINWRVSWRVLMRDKHDVAIKQMCLEDQNLVLQSCSNFTLKSELEPTVIACLAGRDAREVLYTGFYLSKHQSDKHQTTKRLRFLPDICNDDIHKTPFSAKHIPP